LRKILIDARAMAHPEPLEKGISALRELGTESYLYMLNHKNPIPLINLAKQHGFQTLSHEDTQNLWHIIISKSKESTLQELLDV
jgi:hypothetical protein